MSNPAKLDQLPEDKRARKRSRLLLAATLRVGDVNTKANLLNLSTEGAQLDSEFPPEVGAEVWLLRGQLEVRGHVIWVTGHRFGIEFDGQIDESLVLEQIKPRKSRRTIIPFPSR